MRFKHAALAAGLLFACSLASAQGVKISQLPTAPTPNGAEILPESLGACTPNSISCGVTINQIGAFTLANAATLGQLDLTLGVKNILPVANGGTGTATPSLVAGTNITITGSWPNQTIAASGGGGGSGTVTDGTGTTTANELLLSSTTAHAYTNATTLPTSALPALTGDVTSSAGSNSVIVSKVIGLTFPSPVTNDVLGYNGTALAWVTNSSMVYPGAGIANSTGTAWGTSYSATNTIPFNFLPASVASYTGTISSGNCATWSSSGVLQDPGSTCPISVSSASGLSGSPTNGQFWGYATGTGQGWYTPTGSGTVNNGTAGQLAEYASTGNAVSGLTVGTNTLVGGVGSGAAALTPAQAIGVLNSATANAQTVTSYTFALTDENGEVTMSNASANTVCIPANSSVAFPVGTLLTVQQVSTGTTSLAPAGTSGCLGTGVTITSAAYGSSTTQTYSLAGEYGFIQIQQTATNTWNVVAWDTPVGQQLRALSINSEMQAYLAASTPFTEAGTGCTPSAHAGGPFAGTITLAATCTAVVVTLNGASGFTDSNGYACWMGDDTLQAAGTYFGTWLPTSQTGNAITFPIPGAAAATDTVEFHCYPRSL